jgi:signal transduction histidine kinase
MGSDKPCQDCPHEEAILSGKGVQRDKFDDRIKAHLHISVSPILDDGGAVIGSAIIFKDVTQQKEAEERLNQYSKHFKQMVGGLTKELKEAPGLLVDKTKNTVLRQFARGIGSELRGPLEIISEKVFSLKKKISKDDEKTQKVLEVITSEIKKTEQIMLLLLYFARPKTPDKKEVEVHKLVQRIIDKYPPSGKIKVITDISDELPQVFVDPLQTGQVINNLIINADQSMPNGGELRIIAESDKNGVSLSISDNGPGIPKKDLKKLFDPLSTTRAGKMGIGLAISKNLIESNGGSISVKSKEKEFSTFTIVLPTKG